MKPVVLDGKRVGPGEPVYIIAEGANNHAGDHAIAMEMVRAAAATGADAVKFQCMDADAFAVPDYEWYGVYQKLRFTKQEWKDLRFCASDNGISFCVDVLDPPSVDLQVAIGTPFFRLHAGDLVNPYLLEHAARTGVPLLLHTGMTTLGEIEFAIERITAAGNDQIVLLHGFQDHPSHYADMHLRVIRSYQEIFDRPVGFNDHTTDSVAALASVGAGSMAIEKHFTTDRAAKRYDWVSALEPGEFKKMVEDIRNAEVSLGEAIRRPTAKELAWRESTRKTLVAREDLAEGTLLTLEHVDFKRRVPLGIGPLEAERLLGKRLRRAVHRNEPIGPEDLA
ncbi:MAG: N-acetylneuraminate synthase family protein [Deltaproteobacteria bacterium]|nr:N-acetylneuraminate synthase family protein [Deltaproteobacteria bacterium]